MNNDTLDEIKNQQSLINNYIDNKDAKESGQEFIYISSILLGICIFSFILSSTYKYLLSSNQFNSYFSFLYDFASGLAPIIFPILSIFGVIVSIYAICNIFLNKKNKIIIEKIKNFLTKEKIIYFNKLVIETHNRHSTQSSYLEIFQDFLNNKNNDIDKFSHLCYELQKNMHNDKYISNNIHVIKKIYNTLMELENYNTQKNDNEIEKQSYLKAVDEKNIAAENTVEHINFFEKS